MEYFVYFISALIGGVLGSAIILSLLSRKREKVPQRTFEPTIYERSEAQKKASDELDEMLNKFKNN